MDPLGSKDISKIAIQMSLSATRDEENRLKEEFLKMGVRTAAIDYGGEFVSSITKIIERCIVAAKREGVIEETHAEEGSVAGAAHEAFSQMISKAIGLNIGGKIGIARYNDHVCVALFFGIGLLHLNEIAIGLGHRTI